MSNEGTDGPQAPSDWPPPDPGAFPPPPEAPAPGFNTLPPPPPVRRLVRDPGTSLGGVASGLSQHYGIDVSVIRLAFVLFTVISGIGLLLYALAWLIIPKAQVWPPNGVQTVASPLSNRELAIGAILIGLAMVVFISGGSVGEVLVPLLLIGGGVWLLAQTGTRQRSGDGNATWATPDTGVPAGHAAPGQAQYMAGQPQDTVAPGPTGFSAAGSSGYALPPPGGPAGGPTPGTAPKRRRPFRAIVIGLLIIMGVMTVLIIASIVALLAFADFNFDAEVSERYTPETVAEIPPAIEGENGEIVLDLSELDAGAFADGADPLDVEVDLNIGEVRVIIPEDVAVDIEASAGLGSVEVFNSSEEGISPRLDLDAEDPDIRLDINLGLGAVSVQRP